MRHEIAFASAFIVSILQWVTMSSGGAVGPSLSSLTSSMGLHSPSLRTINLEDYDSFSVVVPLVTGSASASSQRINSERGPSNIGKFVVEPPKNHGIMAVIQQLDLPRLEWDLGNPDFQISFTCQDFIQFSQLNGSSSDPICGTVRKSSLSSRPKAMNGPRWFTVTGPMLVTYFRIDVDSSRITTVEIVFTSFSNCSQAHRNDSPHSDENAPNNQNFELVSCNPSSEDDNQTCIDRNLFCDHNINCGWFQPHDFGVDEKFCDMSLNSIKDFGNLNPLPLFPSIPDIWTNRPSATDSNTDMSTHDFFGFHMSPSGTILVIMVTVVLVTLLGLIVKLCCHRCAGVINKPRQEQSSMEQDGVTDSDCSFIAVTPRYARQTNGLYTSYSVPVCPRRQPKFDTPPTYDELFPNGNPIEFQVINPRLEAMSPPSSTMTSSSNRFHTERSASEPNCHAHANRGNCAKSPCTSEADLSF